MPRLFLLITLLALAACSQPATVTDPLSAAPEDLTIDVTILTGRRVKVEDEAHRRQGKMILLADGTLHADWGQGVTWKTRPGLTRTLRREQTAELWFLARQLGFADSSKGDAPVNLGLITPERNEILYLLVFSAGGDTWTFVRHTPADQKTGPELTRMVRALAALAWESDSPVDRVRIEPQRYDFGPDPYARYRIATTQPETESPSSPQP
jgi:hypothetical protein